MWLKRFREPSASAISQRHIDLYSSWCSLDRERSHSAGKIRFSAIGAPSTAAYVRGSDWRTLQSVEFRRAPLLPKY